MINEEIQALIERQEAVSERWRNMLGDVKKKELIYIAKKHIVLHYTLLCNTKRAGSTLAKTGKEALAGKCKLCPENRPEDQLSLSWTAPQSENEFEILVNPYPIFPKHITIASKTHRPQTMDIRDMLDFAEYSGLAVFFNGADCGASIPGHMHYQAAPNGYFENIIEDTLQEDVPYFEDMVNFDVAYRSYLDRDMIFCTFSIYDIDTVQEEMEKIMSAIGRTDDRMMNVMVFKNERSFYVYIFPRKRFRPDCFFAENEEERLLISPATAEMCGVIVTPDIETFNKITVEDVHRIIQES